MSTPVVSAPSSHEHGAGAEHDRGADVGQQQHEREVEGDEPLGVEAGVEVLAVERRGSADVAVLADVGLRHAHAGQALLQVGVDRGDATRGPAA